MKSSFLWDVEPCSQEKALLPASCWFLVVLHFDPENGGDIPLKRPLIFTEPMALYPRRYYASVARKIARCVFMFMLFYKLFSVLLVFIKLVKKCKNHFNIYAVFEVPILIWLLLSNSQCKILM
jgi:hypothetical protein